MLTRVLDKKAIVRIDNLRRYAYEQQGWFQTAVSDKGRKEWHCSCQPYCGYRAFPGVQRLRDLMWSDIMKCWRRALRFNGVLPGMPDSVEVWRETIDRLKADNRKIRDAGLITRSSDMMLLARIPGPIIRGLAHDFPQEFSSTVGARSEDVNKHLEKVLDALYINHEWGKPLGAVAKAGAVIL